MKRVLDELKHALEKAERTDYFNAPASPVEIAAWEKENGAVLPDEIKEFLQLTNGFEYGMNFMVFPLKRIRKIRDWVGVPEGWLHLGQLIGDGCYIVSDESGKLIKCDSECAPLLSDLDLAKWVEYHVLERIYEDYDIDIDE